MPELVIERPSVLENMFYCRARRKRQTLDKCLDDFVNANAFEDRRSACWRCPQGRANRADFQVPDDEEDDDGLILAPRKPVALVNRGCPPVVPRPESSAPSPPLQADTPVDLPPPQPAPPADPSPPSHAPAPDTDTTTEQERIEPMKPAERVKKMPFPDRVRLAWSNTPGKTAEEKQKYVFNRHATDALQKIFGLGSAGSAVAFMVKLTDEGMISEDEHCWTSDLSNYNGESGAGDGDDDDDSARGQHNPPANGPSRRGPKPGPRPKAAPEPPAEDTVTDAEETGTAEVNTNDLEVVLSHAPWLASALRAAALLGQIAPDARILALEAIKQIAALSEEDIPWVLNMLNSIFHEPPPAEPEDEE